MGEKSLQGRIAVVTGASAGVGAAGARKLAALGATVVVVGRSPEKTAAVAGEIGADSYTVDFSRLADVRRLAETLYERYPVIDILANNAGMRVVRRTTTEDGHEMTLQVNHLAPFLLTNLLLGSLAKAEDPRVIVTASDAHAFGRIDLDDLNGTRNRYNSLRRYAISKLANVLFAAELARRGRVTAASFHPGLVDSDFFRTSKPTRSILRSPLGRLMKVSPEEGAAPLVHLATVPDAKSVNGAYFSKLTPRAPKGPQAVDRDLARLLWERSVEMTGLIDWD